jgi:hypothetical protein
MKCGEVLSRLDDYVDDLLAPRERQAVRTHLQTCAACRTREESIIALVKQAHDLARPVEPPSDLWPAIAGRLGDEIVRRPGPSLWRRRTLPPRWLGLAAAAIVLVAGTALTTAWLVGRRTVDIRRPAGTDTRSASLAPEGVRLKDERRQLLAAFQARKGRLMPSTVAVVEKNLRIIDRSLGDIETALRKDPGNRDLTFLLAATYRQELDLLRQAVQLSNDDWTGGKNEKS